MLFILGEFVKSWIQTDWEIVTIVASGDNMVIAERLDKTKTTAGDVDLPCVGVFEMEAGKIIASIEDPVVITMILTHLNRIIRVQDLLACLKVEPRRELACLSKPVIQTLRCTDPCGRSLFAWRSGTGRIWICGKDKISPR